VRLGDKWRLAAHGEAGIYDRIRTHQAWIGDVLLSVQRQGEAEVEFTSAIAIARQLLIEGTTILRFAVVGVVSAVAAGPRLLFALRSSGSDFPKFDWAFDKIPLAFRTFFAMSDLCAQLIYFA
jgi:hypothetical protein